MFTDAVNLIGAGDHAKVVLTLLEVCGTPCAGIYDDNESLWKKELWGVPIIGPVSDLPDKEGVMAVIAIGSNRIRKQISAMFKNVTWPVIVHPQSCVHNSVSIKGGTVIFAGATVQADTKLGCHSIINLGAIVDHDTVIGDFCHIGPNSCVADGVAIEDGAHIGVGAVVPPYTRIASDVTVGAGAVVTKNISSAGLYCGNPAVRITK